LTRHVETSYQNVYKQTVDFSGEWLDEQDKAKPLSSIAFVEYISPGQIAITQHIPVAC